MLNKRALLVAVFCSLGFSGVPFLHGQATGSFSGTVSDKAGAVVSGATVKVSSQDTGLSREARTDDSGHYLIPLLPVAQFTIRVTSQGFQTMEQKGLVGHESAGKAYAYYAKVRRDSVFRKLAGGFLDQVFDGAMGEYVARALQSRRPSMEELEELEAMIAEAKQRARERDDREGGRR